MFIPINDNEYTVKLNQMSPFVTTHVDDIIRISRYCLVYTNLLV